MKGLEIRKRKTALVHKGGALCPEQDIYFPRTASFFNYATLIWRPVVSSAFSKQGIETAIQEVLTVKIRTTPERRQSKMLSTIDERR